MDLDLLALLGAIGFSVIAFIAIVTAWWRLR